MSARSSAMACGTTTSIFTYAYLHRLKDRLKGKLTLTCVSDEETFGPWGARYLMEHHPEVHGDCCLNGEPGSPYTVRFGEKGPLWLKFTVKTPGAHGAYTHASPSATKVAARLVGDLEAITELARWHDYDLGQCYAYSDSASDLPMLEAVWHPVAVNPDTRLERHARRHGWPIVIFSQRTKSVIRRSVSTAATVGIAGAGFLAGVKLGRQPPRRRRLF